MLSLQLRYTEPMVDCFGYEMLAAKFEIVLQFLTLSLHLYMYCEIIVLSISVTTPYYVKSHISNTRKCNTLVNEQTVSSKLEQLQIVWI